MARREHSLLLVHAHPDDESIFTGATMAKYAAERARVTLVTCTMGELGINRLTRSGPADGRHLAEVRARELEAACIALGVADHRFLGGPGRWRDSGPAGASANSDPRSLCGAGLDQPVKELAALISEVRPQVIVTYAADGFYGHPDHIQVHHVTRHAYEMTCDPKLTKLYAATMPKSVLARALRYPDRPAVRRLVGFGSHLRLGTPDEQVTTEIDATAYLDVKLAAMRSHATQIMVDEPYFHAAGLVQLRALGTEYYTLLAGPGGPAPAGRNVRREDDLFSGV